MQITDSGVDHDLILPFELDPHLTEFVIGARGRNDVVHNIDVNVIQDHTIAIGLGTVHVVDDIAEDDTILGRRHFDIRFDIGEIMRSHGDRLRFLHQFQITQSGQFQR